MLHQIGAWHEFRQGAVAIFPICVAAVPIGLLWGTLATERGLSALEIWLMSATIFAGASQFVAIGMWTSPLPIVAIIFTTFMINLRHMMMSASLGRSLQNFTPVQRLIAFYGLTDEIWALSETKARDIALTPSYYAGLFLPLWLSWTFSSLGGSVFGKLLGDPAAYGLDFVFTAMFIGLIVGFRNAADWLPVVVTSAVVSALSFQILPAPWFVILGGIAGVAVSALQAPGSDSAVVEAR